MAGAGRKTSSSELRYARQCRVLGGREARIHGKRVLVVGVGGTGSAAALALAQLGFNLRVVDRDAVQETNLNRQALYAEADVGKPKAEAAAEALRKLNSRIRVKGIVGEFSEKTAALLLRGVNFAVDGSDNFETRAVLNAACWKKGIPWVFSGALGTRVQVSTVVPPRTPCFACWNPKPPKYEVSCGDAGVLASAALAAGAFAAQEVVHLACFGKGGLEGVLLHGDARSFSFRQTRLAKRAGCGVCGARVRA